MKGTAYMNEKPMTLVDFGENITRIVITGGPCSGKTSGLAALMSKLTDRGYKVLISPESATKLINAGIMPGEGELDGTEFQEEILRDTIEQEDRILSAARRYRDKGRKVVILCDRGTMDGEAYVDPSDFKRMLESFGYTERSLCDERYHAVMHLRTAALGAEAFYTLANNSARKEAPELARELDERTFKAWQRHPHPRVIDNSTDFEGKLRRLFVEICGVLGDPVPLEKEDKFLVKPFDPVVISVAWSESTIVQDYLISPTPGEEHRVRARGDGGSFSYYYTIKRAIGVGVRAEQEKMVARREYEELLGLRDPQKLTIKKRRICFFWREQFFETDLFVEPVSDLALMEAERTDRTPELQLPPFIEVVRDVTGDKRYSNSEIAKKKV